MEHSVSEEVYRHCYQPYEVMEYSGCTSIEEIFSLSAGLYPLKNIIFTKVHREYCVWGSRHTLFVILWGVTV